MKKLTILIAAIALVCFTVPAMAEVEWNFYGSARVNTWYVSQDFGDGTNGAGTDDKDSGVRWGSDGQDNSRIGAKVNAEHIKGRIEIQLRGDEGGDPGSTVTVENRIAYGEWDFGPGKLKVGKDYTPISQFISGQVFDEDLGLLGIGTMYGNRTPGLFLSFGGFELALLEPVDSSDLGTGGDVDSFLPKIEAKFGMSFDAFNFNVRGGYQTFEIEDVVGISGQEDVDVTSWAIGADVGVNFGPAYVKGAVSLSRNADNAAWHLPGVRNDASPAVFDGDDDTDDSDTLMFALVGGIKVSDMLSFEGGFGYREDDTDVTGRDEDEAWEAYIQSVIVLAPGVYLVPEIGFLDMMKDGSDSPTDDEGDAWYAGAKWQIDF